MDVLLAMEKEAGNIADVGEGFEGSCRQEKPESWEEHVSAGLALRLALAELVLSSNVHLFVIRL